MTGAARRDTPRATTAATRPTTAAPRATTAAGRLLGEWDDGVAVFRGVPFAQPPVGALRWRPPLRAERWDGERPAHAFGPAPLQPSPPRTSIMYLANFADRRPPVLDEDCLYLNVWTPDPSAATASATGLPVMVWIHGGGNRYGYGSQDIHDGRAMARRGVVFVTLNHRLGALGFLAHPGLAAQDEFGASGNYGLLDIVAALEWVRENIARFGGDPARVTLAGNSAGAAHICHLMASAAARPLFRAAIGQSASGIGRAEGPLPTQAAAQRQGLRWAEEFGGADHADRADQTSRADQARRADSVDRATAANGPDISKLRRLPGADLVLKGHFGPVVDGRVLTEATDDVFGSGRQHAVPLLVGTNADEGSVYAGPDAVRDLPTGPGFAEQYPAPAGDPGQARRSARRYTGESRFVYPVWQWATTHRATSGAPTWMYRFTRRTPPPPGLDLAAPSDGLPDYGVFHTAELPYVLDNLDRRTRPGPWPWQPVDRRLATELADAWARFAASGDPNGGTLPVWPEFTGDDDRLGAAAVMVFGDTVEAGTTDRLAALRLLGRQPRPR